MPGRVHYETAERIATITLDHPAALNAFDHEMCLELRRIWADVEANPDVACAILTGAGEKAFCTGWDVTSLATGESPKLVPGDRWSAPYGHITALQLGKPGRITAPEALELGLVGEVVPALQLMPRARELAAIIAQYSPTALARTKRAIWESLDHGLNDALDAAHAQVERHLGHPDPVEGSKAFLEKRRPKWEPYRGTG
jgi:enoyl-CoA hydratase/carnithine racemase